MRTMLAGIVVGGMLLSGYAMGGQLSKELGCSPRSIMEAICSEELDAALVTTQKCTASNKADLAALKEKNDGKPSGSIGVIGMVEFTTGAFLIAEVEILTLRGSWADAEAALGDAERFDQQHPRAGLTSSISGAPLSVARAFVLEKKGKLDEAAAAYEAILLNAAEKGWPDASSTIHGRLAAIALLRGDYAGAEQWSRNATAADPGAGVVNGALLKKQGDVNGARASFAAALKLMDDAKKAGNLSLPIYFAEYRHALQGLGSLPAE